MVVRHIACLNCGKVEAYSGRCHSNRKFCSKECRSERFSRSYFLKRFGTTPEQYDRVIASHDGKCAICKTTTPGGSGGFHLDHDHKTGNPRGMLCSACNRGIGFLADDAIKLYNASEYLSTRMSLQDLVIEATK
jgi:hypothetical protein